MNPAPVAEHKANALDSLASLMKAAGDPLRLEILRVLRNNAFGALELSDIFAMRQNAMSHHLKILSRAGLVTFRREGTHMFYRRAGLPAHYHPLHREILNALDEVPVSDVILARIRGIEEARTAASREFFRANADKFRAQQDLIAGYPQYGEAVVGTLDRLTGGRRHTVIEVGPGEGELLADLHRHFDRVIAIDNSAEMLDRSRQFALSRGLDNVEFIHGDTATARALALSGDVVTLNMVLHHTPAPAAVIADLARLLNPEGVLVITELCQHDQDWARSACGDLWLGFEPDELSDWAAESGLAEGSAEYLPLKNGFRIQLRQFIRTSPPLPPTPQGDRP
ncbi:MAG: metalloregulator ArsR/SmtB family transcription factor [Porticoccaceae bacterium]